METSQGSDEFSKVTPQELRSMMDCFAPFADLPEPLIKDMAAMAERIFVPAGEKLVSIGDKFKYIYFIEHGRAFAFGSKAIHNKEVFYELARGETFGFIGAMAKREAGGDLYTLRDTKFLRFTVQQMQDLIGLHPEFIEGYSKMMAEYYLRSQGKGKLRNQPKIFTILPMEDSKETRLAIAKLESALTEVCGSGIKVDSNYIEKKLHKNSFGFEMTDWLEEVEEKNNFAILVCDPKQTEWTKWCLAQTDRIMVATNAKKTPEVAKIDALFEKRCVANQPLKVDLLLIHAEKNELPRDTEKWMELKCRRRHHHVRLNNKIDFMRAARRLAEKAYGLVLGGGGARGFAHIGILKALEDSGIPVDVIGGTSMGSVMAACYARGWSPEYITNIAAELFQSSRTVMDIDFPLISILSGQRLDGILKSVFNSTDIADLWTPFFCVSSNLNKGAMQVHDRGLLWKAVRASCSLPGIFPPVQQDNQLLVDGGILNNVPSDIVREEAKGGTIIAVDVGAGGSENLRFETEHPPTGWKALRNKMNPMTKNQQVTNIFQVLLWSTTLSSKQYLERLLESGEINLFLTPPVQEFELLGFDALHELYDIGYEYGMYEIARWKDKQD